MHIKLKKVSFIYFKKLKYLNKMNNLLKSNIISDKQKDRINKAHYQSLYLVEKFSDNNEITLKLTGSTLNIYTVTIKDLDIKCDCPDIYQCNKHNLYCKHICFVICMIGKLYIEEIFINKNFTNDNKLKIFSRLFNYLVETDSDIECKFLKEKYLLLKSDFEKKNNLVIDTRNKDEECSICYNKLDSEIFTCNNCLNAIHTTCLSLWLKKNNTCVFCRHNIKTDSLYKNTRYLNISK
jgi:hypothetical protein